MGSASWGLKWIVNVKREVWRVRQKVWETWDKSILSLEKLNGYLSVLPRSAEDIFVNACIDADGVVKFDIRPVFLSVTERRSNRSKNIFVAMDGWLSLKMQNVGTVRLLTESFGTRVGYFRTKKHELHHVFGAHYDMVVGDATHPVFHAQMKFHQKFADKLTQQHQFLCKTIDHTDGIYRAIRIPTAQMDFFSVLLQVCADHLISGHSCSNDLAVFKEIKERCGILVGAAHKLRFLNSATASSCYRATHWYDVQ